jgi:hypothetical protein
MYLIFVCIAAIITTIVWYKNLPGDKYRVGLLSLIYWGATIMWAVDYTIGYIQEGGPFFDMSVSATLLGLVVVAAGLAVWAIALLIKGTRRNEA